MYTIMTVTMGMMYSSSFHTFSAHALLLHTDGEIDTWILNSRAFYVTPHEEGFFDYRGGWHVVIHLVENYACDIVGI